MAEAPKIHPLLRPHPTPKGAPTKFGIALFDGFEALDVFGPLEVLNLLSYMTKISLYRIAPTLEPVTTKPAAKLSGSDFEQKVVPTHTYKNVPKDMEVLIVPGGAGTEDNMEQIQLITDFIKGRYPKLRYLMSVCNGASLLARSGVLDGKNATTSKAVWSTVVPLGPKTNWITHARWVEDGNIWTSSGVSAGIDATLAFISKHYAHIDEEMTGPDGDMADHIAEIIEHPRTKDWQNDPFADVWGLPRN